MRWNQKGRRHPRFAGEMAADTSGEPVRESMTGKDNSGGEIQDAVWLRRMISHNVRMPMSVIAGFGELLRQGLVTEEETGEIVQSICENITYMNQILSVILEEDGDTLNLERVDMSDMISRMEGYVSEMAKKSGISVNVQTDGSGLYIKAEPVPVMRIFYQLFENAFKYLDRGNSIQIKAYPVEKRQVLIVFKDDGPGMDAAEAERIFEKDFRGSNSAGKRGSGFGMYDVKRIVEGYGGTVEASSRKGKGLVVFIVFPMAVQPGKEGTA